MPIQRAEKSSEHPYTVISDEMLRDESLSWKARGLLSYIFSNYDDWSISISHLTNQAPDGKDSVWSAIDELIEAGYLEREQQRNEKGQITGIKYTVIESGNSDLLEKDRGDSVSTIECLLELGFPSVSIPHVNIFIYKKC